MIKPARLLFCLLLAAVFPAVPARACFWIQGTTIEGRLVAVDGLNGWQIPQPFGNSGSRAKYAGDAQVLRELRNMKLEEFAERFAGNTVRPIKYSIDAAELKTLRKMNPADQAELLSAKEAEHTDIGTPGLEWPEGLDAASLPLLHGKAEESLAQISALNKARAGNYYILANLAVAQELSGKDQEALLSLESALKIRPDAHSGTEWMHAAVLRAKIALVGDPGWLNTHTISGIPLDDLPSKFTLKDGDRPLGLDEIHSAMLAHAMARTLFVKPVDLVTGTLLKELARVEARLWMVERGLPVLELAKEYGATGTDSLKTDWERSARKGVTKRFMLSPVFYFGGISLFCAVLVLFIVRRNFRKRSIAV